MGIGRSGWPVRLAPALACALAAGCLTPGPFGPQILPEQRALEVRDPTRLPPAPLPNIPPPPTVSAPLPDTAPSRDLSLDEAIRIALANSRVVRVLTGVSAASSGQTIYDPAISNTRIDQEAAVFDPTVSASAAHGQTDPPQAELRPGGVGIGGRRTETTDLTAGVSQRTIAGGTLALDASKSTSRTPRVPSILNPLTRTSAGLSFTQPLLRGAGAEVNLAPLVIARINTERSFFQYKDAVQELVRGVIDAYWAVVFTRTDVWARRQQVEQGETANVRAEARMRLGLGTTAEAAQSRSSLATFRANLLTAEANLLQREAALRNILGLSPSDPMKLVLTTPPTDQPVEPRWDQLIRLAEQQRPDIIELKLILEADQQQVILARNEALPQVDATAAYRWNGLDGETPGGRVSTGHGQFTEFTVGVNFSVPLGLRQGRAALREAELVIARDRANLEQGLHAAVHDLAGSVRNLAQTHAQYLAFQQTRTAARESLEQQLAEFRAGRAIFLNVLQAISEWGNAVSAEAQALAQYNTELANLERQTGTILDTHGVRFFEERYQAAGPLGKHGAPGEYPSAVLPGPNAERYPVSSEPPEAALERDRPRLPKGDGPPAKLKAPAPGPAGGFGADRK
jgi:outer membrane protein TolC